MPSIHTNGTILELRFAPAETSSLVACTISTARAVRPPKGNSGGSEDAGCYLLHHVAIPLHEPLQTGPSKTKWQLIGYV